MLGRDQAAVQQLLVERRHHREHDDHLRYVRRDQLLAVLVRAVEQGTARVDRLDHALIGRAPEHFHAVAARHQALLAAREACERLAAGELDQIVTAVDGDDLAVKQVLLVVFQRLIY